MANNDKILKHLHDKDYKNSSELCQKISKINDTVLLSFSCGKDSIASWLLLRKYFKRIIPVYFYGVPNLEFIENSIKYYEKYFDIKIIRLPHPTLIKQLKSGLFQDDKNISTMIKLDMPSVTYDDMFRCVKEDYNLPLSTYTAIGNRATDNLQRWTAFVTNGCVNENRKTFWAIFDYSMDDLCNELKTAKINLPIDYKLWGKTFDGLQYRFIEQIRTHFPKDYDTIKHFFTLIDIEILRYEK